MGQCFRQCVLRGPYNGWPLLVVVVVKRGGQDRFPSLNAVCCANEIAVGTRFQDLCTDGSQEIEHTVRGVGVGGHLAHLVKRQVVAVVVAVGVGHGHESLRQGLADVSFLGHEQQRVEVLGIGSNLGLPIHS